MDNPAVLLDQISPVPSACTALSDLRYPLACHQEVDIVHQLVRLLQLVKPELLLKPSFGPANVYVDVRAYQEWRAGSTVYVKRPEEAGELDFGRTAIANLTALGRFINHFTSITAPFQCTAGITTPRPSSCAQPESRRGDSTSPSNRGQHVLSHVAKACFTDGSSIDDVALALDDVLRHRSVRLFDQLAHSSSSQREYCKKLELWIVDRIENNGVGIAVPGKFNAQQSAAQATREYVPAVSPCSSGYQACYDDYQNLNGDFNVRESASSSKRKLEGPQSFGRPSMRDDDPLPAPDYEAQSLQSRSPSPDLTTSTSVEISHHFETSSLTSELSGGVHSPLSTHSTIMTTTGEWEVIDDSADNSMPYPSTRASHKHHPFQFDDCRTQAGGSANQWVPLQRIPACVKDRCRHCISDGILWVAAPVEPKHDLTQLSGKCMRVDDVLQFFRLNSCVDEKWQELTIESPREAAIPTSLTSLQRSTPHYMTCIPSGSGSDLIYELDMHTGEFLPRQQPKQFKIWDCAAAWSEHLLVMAGGKRCKTQRPSKEVWLLDVRTNSMNRHTELDLPVIVSSASILWNKDRNNFFLIATPKKRKHDNQRGCLYRFDIRQPKGWEVLDSVSDVLPYGCGVVFTGPASLVVACGITDEDRSDRAYSLPCVDDYINSMSELPCLTKKRAYPELACVWNSVVCIGGEVQQDIWCNDVNMLSLSALHNG